MFSGFSVWEEAIFLKADLDQQVCMTCLSYRTQDSVLSHHVEKLQKWWPLTEPVVDLFLQFSFYLQFKSTKRKNNLIYHKEIKEDINLNIKCSKFYIFPNPGEQRIASTIRIECGRYHVPQVGDTVQGNMCVLLDMPSDAVNVITLGESSEGNCISTSTEAKHVMQSEHVTCFHRHGQHIYHIVQLCKE